MEKVSTEQKPRIAYNLNVSDWHTYFVCGSGSQTEGVWVHNGCGSRVVQSGGNAINKRTANELNKH
ncbi:polymorphic toxin-type HINT domain-containing protein [Eikenella corrodens]|uniref:polymorphic toxin-type HINT domain-containing protein n=1 Tax=Eikenella corrodens TaxID=539 RepID=UPI003D665D02